MRQLEMFWENFFNNENEEFDWWNRLKTLNESRRVKIARIKGKGHIFQRINLGNEEKLYYQLHISMLMKQGNHFFQEERIIPHRFILKSDQIIEHRQMEEYVPKQHLEKLELESEAVDRTIRFTYDRRAAVQYAERWWNSYNPAYRKFEVDCTNYISQCLRAGGAPMRGAPNRNQGWWYQGNNWSNSWAVAHALRWFLSGSTHGLKGTEVESPSELIPGDVICYDFEGDGRWNHNTIVVEKDADGMPLVNAHTQNSRHRYWSYEDSSAYTPNIQYKFFRIGD
ncbi:amidase domain-containing protein [Ornithinibacillus bavariensis]|uniref:amidase domain-containing protein n=1 Tax=Ornithinibacillus bavariensis TaxID=545502 RepID=UPI003D20FB1F